MEPVSFSTAIVVAVVSAIGAGILWWLKRHSDLVDELRKALDRGRIRENALVVVCELLIYAIDHMEGEPSKAVRELRERACAVLIEARRVTHGRDE